MSNTTAITFRIKPETYALLLDIEKAESTCHKHMLKGITENYVDKYIHEAKEMPLPTDSTLLLNAVKKLDS